MRTNNAGAGQGPVDGPQDERAGRGEARGAELVRQPGARLLLLAELFDQPSHGCLFRGVLRRLMVAGLRVQIGEFVRVGAGGSVALDGRLPPGVVGSV